MLIIAINLISLKLITDISCGNKDNFFLIVIKSSDVNSRLILSVKGWCSLMQSERDRKREVEEGKRTLPTYTRCVLLYCSVTCFLWELYRLAFIIHFEMFAVFKAEAIFAAFKQKVILYKMFILVQQSLFLLQDQRNNEGSLKVVFL